MLEGTLSTEQALIPHWIQYHQLSDLRQLERIGDFLGVERAISLHMPLPQQQRQQNQELKP